MAAVQSILDKFDAIQSSLQHADVENIDSRAICDSLVREVRAIVKKIAEKGGSDVTVKALKDRLRHLRGLLVKTKLSKYAESGDVPPTYLHKSPDRIAQGKIDSVLKTLGPVFERREKQICSMLPAGDMNINLPATLDTLVHIAYSVNLFSRHNPKEELSVLEDYFKNLVRLYVLTETKDGTFKRECIVPFMKWIIATRTLFTEMVVEHGTKIWLRPAV